MAKYLTPDVLIEMNAAREKIYDIRTEIYNKHKIDILDTDALSALSIYEIVSQYDPEYNINFSRNGEDAKSGSILIEMKASRIDSPYTKKGKLRKRAECDAVFLFHAMGDIKHDRYLFVARDKNDLSIKRIYDIANVVNSTKVYDKLIDERNIWLLHSRKDESKMKRDVISISEEFLINLFEKTNYLKIGDVKVFKDW
ncbi:MAG: hypothetical protein EBR30_02930 [Cytophagia bacterium]|nr:hypothetical protein [Cytophagia bacterium]